MPQSARILITACPKPAVPLEDCQRECGSRSLRLSMKTQVYRAIIIPTLLYGAETQFLYRKKIRLLERLHQRCLRSILGIKWLDCVSNVEVFERASLPSIQSILLHAQLRWAGHVSNNGRIRKPKAVFVSELQEGKRNRGAPRKRYNCLLYTSPSPRDMTISRMPSSA